VGDECYDFIRGLWYSINCFWVSRPDSIRQAEHKTYQLTVAARLGLPIPRTIISNNPTDIVEFVAACKSGVVAKPVYMGFIDNPPRTIFTTVVRSEDLNSDESLRMSPVIFQELVPKASDIRVTVIGSEVFATEINAKLPATTPDWRVADFNDLQHSPHTLSSGIREKCLKLVRELGLEFGAIDLGLCNDGSYFFFEINPNGQWAWLEQTTGCPLTKTLVDFLEGPLHEH
jgi:glutathione synthase/RimK-type ligase-like ATP-grasp enzyme